MTAKGLTLNVHRTTRGDFTLDGVSGRADRLTLVGYRDESVHPARSVVRPLPDGSQVFEVKPDRPPVILVVRQFGADKILSILPAVEDGTEAQPGWFMFGGNYASLDDSRLSDLTQQLTGHRFYGAVAIHDRQES